MKHGCLALLEFFFFFCDHCRLEWSSPAGPDFIRCPSLCVPCQTVVKLYCSESINFHTLWCAAIEYDEPATIHLNLLPACDKTWQNETKHASNLAEYEKYMRCRVNLYCMLPVPLWTVLQCGFLMAYSALLHFVAVISFYSVIMWKQIKEWLIHSTRIPLFLS